MNGFPAEKDSGFKETTKVIVKKVGFRNSPIKSQNTFQNISQNTSQNTSQNPSQKTSNPTSKLSAKSPTPITERVEIVSSESFWQSFWQKELLRKLLEAPDSPETTGPPPKPRCQICHKTFGNKSNLRKHERRGNCYSSLYCEICDRDFVKPALFKLHQESHTHDERVSVEHHCNFCKKVFKAKGNLIEHQRDKVCQTKHKLRLEHEFKCGICTNSYVQKRNLDAHVKQAHKPKYEYEKYACDECENLIFSTKGALTRHTKTKHSSHSDSKKYSCVLCLQQFSTKSNLEKHLKKQICQKPKPDFINCSNCGFRETIQSSSTPKIVNCSACNSVILIHQNGMSD